MNLGTLGLVVASVLLSSLSQVVLKLGMSAPGVAAALAMTPTSPVEVARAILCSPLVLAGLTCFGFSAVLWLFVLARIPVSSAYPMVALGIVVTVSAGALALGEPMSAYKLIGVLLIIAGVFSVALA